MVLDGMKGFGKQVLYPFCGVSEHRQLNTHKPTKRKTVQRTLGLKKEVTIYAGSSES